MPALQVDHDGPVCTLTLNRPDKLNAINLQMCEELIAARAEIRARPDTRVVLLRGAGRCFSAGADLHYVDSIYQDPARARQYLETLRDAISGLEALDQPVIGVVHGFALAGGLELVMGSDLIVADEDAQIGDQHMSWGFIPGGGGSQRLPRWIGLPRARDLLYTGRWVSGREAYELGLVSRVVAADELDSTVRDLAEEIASKSPEAIARTKVLARSTMEMPLHTGLELEITEVMAYYARDEFRLAIEGFKDRTRAGFPPRRPAPDVDEA
jgi:enoyl-CoA hydratase